MSHRIVDIVVLIWPPAVWDLLLKLLHTFYTRLEELSSFRVWFSDQLYGRAIIAHEFNITFGAFRINHTDKWQFKIGANHGQTNPHIAGGRFNHRGRLCDLAGFQRPF